MSVHQQVFTPIQSDHGNHIYEMVVEMLVNRVPTGCINTELMSVHQQVFTPIQSDHGNHIYEMVVEMLVNRVPTGCINNVCSPTSVYTYTK